MRPGGFSIDRRRRRFFGRIGEERAARGFHLLQRATHEVGVALGFQADRRERVAQLGHRVFLERQARFQLHQPRFEHGGIVATGAALRHANERTERPRPMP